MGDLQNDSWLLVYNSHQPSSNKNKFPQNMRSDFCKAVVRDATALAKKEPDLIGFVRGHLDCNGKQFDVLREHMQDQGA